MCCLQGLRTGRAAPEASGLYVPVISLFSLVRDWLDELTSSQPELYRSPRLLREYPLRSQCCVSSKPKRSVQNLQLGNRQAGNNVEQDGRAGAIRGEKGTEGTAVQEGEAGVEGGGVRGEMELRASEQGRWKGVMRSGQEGEDKQIGRMRHGQGDRRSTDSASVQPGRELVMLTHPESEPYI